MLKAKEGGEVLNSICIIMSVKQAQEHFTWLSGKRKERTDIQVELKVSEASARTSVSRNIKINLDQSIGVGSIGENKSEMTVEEY